MNLRTTINTLPHIYDILSNLCEHFDISYSEVIHVIIELLSQKQGQFMRDRFTTQYQSVSADAAILHVRLSSNDMEFSKDLRRFYRASFSLLIAEALELFYEEIFSALKNLDNYQGSCHFRVYYSNNGALYWKHIWGNPDQRELLRPKEE